MSVQTKQTVRYPIFHGTDYDIAKQIESVGFIVRKNEHHWLGNGIYFFKDCNLAIWWAKAQHREFGSTVKTPAVINAQLIVDRSRVLDLRDLADLKQFMDWKVELDSMISNDHEIDIQAYRCALFDGIFDKKDKDVIIGCFDSEGKKYISDILGLGDALDQLKLIFGEVQFCVKESKQKELIADIDIEDVSSY